MTRLVKAYVTITRRCCSAFLVFNVSNKQSSLMAVGCRRALKSALKQRRHWTVYAVAISLSNGICGTGWSTVGFVHESPLGRIGDALPDGDGLGITWIHGPHVFIVAPVSGKWHTNTTFTLIQAERFILLHYRAIHKNSNELNCVFALKQIAGAVGSRWKSPLCFKKEWCALGNSNGFHI